MKIWIYSSYVVVKATNSFVLVYIECKAGSEADGFAGASEVLRYLSERVFNDPELEMDEKYSNLV